MEETSNSELVYQERDESHIKPSDRFLALDIRTDEDDSPASQPLVKSFSRKGSQRGGGEKKGKDGETNSGGPGLCETTPLFIHVSSDGGHSMQLPATAPTPGGKFRRLGRKPSPWLDPKRVLLVFATLSSMGTLILLYFTLSMGKMTSSNSDAR